MLGSDAETAKLPEFPEVTLCGAMGYITGAIAALTVTVVFAVADPQPLVAVNARFTVVPIAVVGAVKFGLVTVALSKAPAFAVQRYMNGPVPSEVPLNPTVPPEPTVYGPPALAVVGGAQ